MQKYKGAEEKLSYDKPRKTHKKRRVQQVIHERMDNFKSLNCVLILDNITKMM
jgi:hypothetical protein